MTAAVLPCPRDCRGSIGHERSPSGRPYSDPIPEVWAIIIKQITPVLKKIKKKTIVICHTVLKCVACCTFLTGCIRASRTSTEISAPEYLKHYVPKKLFRRIIPWKYCELVKWIIGIWFRQHKSKQHYVVVNVKVKWSEEVVKYCLE